MKSKFIRKFTCRECNNAEPMDFKEMLEHISHFHGCFYPMNVYRSGITTFSLKRGRLQFRNEFTWWVGTLKLEEISEGPA